MQDASIENIIRECLRGNAQAQKLLYDNYKRKLLGLCRRYARNHDEAEDIFQEAMIKIFNSLKTINNTATVESWMKSITVRTAIDFYRKNKNSIFIEMDGQHINNEIDENFDILGHLNHKEIFDLIATLPTGYRTVLNLYLVDGYEHQEIAELLGISVGTSKSQYSRAKHLLKHKLSEIGITSHG
jgi:RNA polymerase sigma factor (sigma-70 family)